MIYNDINIFIKKLDVKSIVMTNHIINIFLMFLHESTC